MIHACSHTCEKAFDEDSKNFRSASTHSGDGGAEFLRVRDEFQRFGSQCEDSGGGLSEGTGALSEGKGFLKEGGKAGGRWYPRRPASSMKEEMDMWMLSIIMSSTPDTWA